MKPLNGKAALVTGASRGIGRAIARRLAEGGARVVLTARDEGLLRDAVSDIEKAGGEAAFLALDLCDSAAVGALTDFAKARFGRIDIVVNNAGATKRGDFLALTEADWEDGFALKFRGAVRLARATWPALRAAHGSLLNIAGVGGRTPGAEFSIGGSVNAALLSLTKSLADLGVRDGVQVNAINPGPVRTDRLTRRLEALAAERGTDLDAAAERFARDAQVVRLGEPEDIAALAAFIVSPAGRLLHGSLIDIDGGQTKTL